MAHSTIELVSSIYHNWREEEGISKIVSLDNIAKNDYNLSPSRYVSQNNNDEVLPLDEAVLELKEAEEERQEADRKLQAFLRSFWDHDGE